MGIKPNFRQKHFIERGLVPVVRTPDEFARFIKDGRAVAAEIVKESGAQPQ